MIYIENIIYAFWVFLPAGMANMTPVILAKTPLLSELNFPLDFNLKLRGLRLLGKGKTIRGIIGGVLAGITVAWMQLLLNFDLEYNPIVWGGLLGLGALGGDALKSFFKRQLNIDSGKSWFPFDQSDYIFGGILLSIWYIKLDWFVYFNIFWVYFGLHLVTCYFGYKLGFKKSPI